MPSVVQGFTHFRSMLNLALAGLAVYISNKNLILYCPLQSVFLFSSSAPGIPSVFNFLTSELQIEEISASMFALWHLSFALVKIALN